MKNTKNIALCGIVSALATVVMMAAYFPYLTYAIPAISGCLLIVLVIECGAKWALVGYAVSGLLVLLAAEPEAKLLFIGFFGYYPIIKEKIEKLQKRWIEYILKVLIFNVAIVAIYFVVINVMGMPIEDMGGTFKYGTLIMLLAGNVSFIVYDIAVSRMIGLYFNRFHQRIKKML